MKYLFAVLFAVGVLVTSCWSACFFDQPQRGQNIDGCAYEGELHLFGSSWRTENCLSCSCYSDGSIKCCSLTFRPVYDKKKCKAVFNKETCKFTVMQNPASTQPCDSYAMVG
ncbi:beta-microseminoprotein [Bombina bombina]|uniref:beta-microseminoprotein n=1 Tax=Bombina bombina TaxID=8345 RepID=UPI00235A6239|nr:beta-microseminoprotein [Bombina bombina]